jgi:alcohol dehydrogenase class IV
MTAEVLGCSTGLGEYEDASSVVERLNSLIRYLQIPTNLQQFGVKPSALDYLVDAAYEIRRLLDNNPIKLNKNDIRAIYAKVI